MVLQTQLIDFTEVSRAISIFLPAGQVTECRVLDAMFSGDGRTVTATGFFDDPAKLGAELQKIRRGKIYIIPNPVDPALLARASNRLKVAGKGDATADGHITSRHWLLIDCDAKRPSGISANEIEHAAAIAVARAIAEFLTARGWPAPIVADSGNGGHLVYRVDLPTNDGGLVRRCLQALGQRFNDAQVAVDESVYNPSRIWKLYGTRAVKGDSTADRPWRMSRIISAPDAPEVVVKERLESLAADAESPRAEAQGVSIAAAGSFDLAAFVGRHLPNAKGPEPWKGSGRIWELPTSPLCEHHDRQCFVGQQPNGAIVAGCHHNSCQGRWGWRELREQFEPRRDRQQNAAGPDIRALVATAQPTAAADEPLERGPDDPGEMPDSLLSVPGFINAVVAWNLAEAYKPQPAMALGGALCLLATLTGRKIRDSVNTRTNLYCLAVGETGCGKERARLVNKEVLHAAGLERMIGPEGIASASGLISAVEQQPAILFQVDEIGRFLKTLGNPNQSPHLYNVTTALMKLYTSSNTIYKGDAYADAKKNRIINQPHVCLYGTTVPKSLYDGLTEDSVTDGFVNRILLWESRAADGQRAQGDLSIGAAPQGIVEVARWWGAFDPGGNMSSQNPQPVVVPVSDGAKTILADLARMADEEASRVGPPMSALWQRAEEQARKLGLLWACSENHLNPIVTAEAAGWARRLIEYGVRRIISLASRWVAANPFDAKRKSVYRIIEACGPDGATKTLLNNRVTMPAKERGEMLADLIECKQIVCVQQATATKPTIRYIAAKFIPTLAH